MERARRGEESSGDVSQEGAALSRRIDSATDLVPELWTMVTIAMGEPANDPPPSTLDAPTSVGYK